MRVFFFFFFAGFVASYRVVVFGMAGSGKSSLIRALCDLRQDAIRISSEGEGTHHHTSYACAAINASTMVTDTPGFGTRLFPMVHSFPSDMNLALLVVSSRLYMQHYEFVEKFLLLVPRLKVPLLVVRSQTDIYPSHDPTYIMEELFKVPIEVLPFSTRDQASISQLRSVIHFLSVIKE